VPAERSVAFVDAGTGGISFSRRKGEFSEWVGEDPDLTSLSLPT